MAALTGAPDSPQATVEALGPQPEIADASAPLATAEIRLQRPLVPLLAMLLLVLSLVAGISIIYYLFYSTLGLLAITFFWTRSLAQNITVQRRLRTKWAVVGDLIEEDFVIANEGRLPALWVEVRDDSTIPDFNPGVVESIGPGEERQFHARTVCRRRGLYTLGPVRILTGDPFGIFRGSIVYYQVNSFIVYPPIMEGPGIPLPYGTVGGSSRSSLKTYHVTTDAAGIRDFAPGDGLSRIHWLSTARRGQLQVKEFDLEPSGNLWVILDMDGAVHVGEGDESTEEYAVKLAGAITYQAIRENKAVGVIASSSNPAEVEPSKGARQLWRIMEDLATVTADGREPLGSILQQVSRALERGLSVVIITPSTDPTWLRELASLRQRASTPAVILLDQVSFGGTEQAQPIADQLTSVGIVANVVMQGQPFRTVAVGKGQYAEHRRAQAQDARARGFGVVPTR